MVQPEKDLTMSLPPDLRDFSKDEIKEALQDVRHPIDVAVFDSQNYFNLGSIVRMCHSFLVRRIYAIDTKFYKKAAMGAYKYEDIRKVTMEDFLQEASSRNLVVFERRAGMETQSLISYEWPETPLVVFGSETSGIPDSLLDVATDVVSIPMFGVHNDHNVACAASIAVYDFVSKHIAK